MDNYILDYEHKKTIQLSNDAFYYLQYDEELLDESNLEEAQEIQQMFPFGFYINEGWTTVKDSDLIEATFIPYKKSDIDWDEYIELTKYLRAQIKWLDSNHIRLWWHNLETNSLELKGDFEVCVNEFGNKYFKTNNISTYFLKRFHKRQ